MPRHQGWPGLFWNAFKTSRNPMVLLDAGRHVVDVNGAYVKLSGYSRSRAIDQPAARLLVGGPAFTPREWATAIAAGDFTGETTLARADGSEVTVQWAAHPELVTGRRLVLLVELSTSRWGRRFRRDSTVEATGSLTEREREVVRLVASGGTSPEIADQLHISPRTASTHVRNAMTKLGARSRAQLVAKALAEGHALD